MTPKQILTLADAYIGHCSVSDRTLSVRIGCHTRYIAQLRLTGSCQFRSIALALDGFRAIWPADLEWPADVAAFARSEVA